MSPHMCVDGLREGPVPVVDHAVDLWLDQQLCPLTGLQLGEEKSALLNLLRFSDDFKMIRDHSKGWSTVKLNHRYLDDVFLAGLVLGGPIHRPPSQINRELGLGLVAAKLLKSRKRYESMSDTEVIWRGHVSRKTVMNRGDMFTLYTRNQRKSLFSKCPVTIWYLKSCPASSSSLKAQALNLLQCSWEQGSHSYRLWNLFSKLFMSKWYKKSKNTVSFCCWSHMQINKH